MLVPLTVTPGRTAADLSEMVPVMAPRVSCAAAGADAKASRSSAPARTDLECERRGISSSRPRAADPPRQNTHRCLEPETVDWGTGVIAVRGREVQGNV